MSSQSDVAITYDPNWLELWSKRFADPLSDAETFRIDDEGCLLAIGEKAATISQIQGQYMGLLKFTQIGWREMMKLRDTATQQERDQTHCTGALSAMIGRGNVSIQAIAYHGVWSEHDTIEDYITAEKIVAT